MFESDLSEHQFNFCLICRESFDDSLQRDEEHIVPLSLGGSLTSRNICKKCNNAIGGDFEGRVINHFFMKCKRYFNALTNRSSKLSHPFTGTHILTCNTKIRYSNDGSFDLVKREIDVYFDENNIQINVRGKDGSEEELIEDIFKKIDRDAKSKNIPINKNDLSSKLYELIKSNKNDNVIDRPAIQMDLSIDLNDWQLLWIKIAYQLAFFEYGKEYFNDTIGKRIAKGLFLKQIPEGITCDVWIDPAVMELFPQEGSHWAMFVGNSCFIRLFDICGVVALTESYERPWGDPSIYRFDFKNNVTQKLDVMKLAEFLAKSNVIL